LVAAVFIIFTICSSPWWDSWVIALIIQLATHTCDMWPHKGISRDDDCHGSNNFQAVAISKRSIFKLDTRTCDMWPHKGFSQDGNCRCNNFRCRCFAVSFFKHGRQRSAPAICRMFDHSTSITLLIFNYLGQILLRGTELRNTRLIYSKFSPQ